MPSKLTLKKIFVVFIFLTFSFGSSLIYEKYFLEANSDSFSLNERQKISKILFKSKLGKQLSFVSVQLEFSELADLNADITEIKGYITLLKSSDNIVNYEWVLPEGVFLIEGAQQQVLNNVPTETPQEVKIKVSGFSKEEKKLISLSAHTRIGNTTFSNVGLLSSRPEDSFEFIANKNFNENYNQTDLSSESPQPSKDQINSYSKDSADNVERGLVSPRNKIRIQR
ncbi:MAG: hypothetical protein HUU56_03510 [Bdellovibrionaceae bacterium]|nr:hypothetical protein [Pseudobdellovibrionaceae bacterium]